jgi:hypothetical protein
MWNDDLEISLHTIALSMDEWFDEYDILPDMMDIEGLCVSLDEHPDFMGAGVPASMTWDD